MDVSTESKANLFFRTSSWIQSSFMDRCLTLPEPILLHMALAALLSLDTLKLTKFSSSPFTSVMLSAPTNASKIWSVRMPIASPRTMA